MARQNKVLIVEHSPVVAEGLKSLFEETEYRVIATLPTLESALERLSALNPDIVVLNPMLIDFSQRLKLRHIFQEYPNLLLAAMTVVDAIVFSRVNNEVFFVVMAASCSIFLAKYLRLRRKHELVIAVVYAAVTVWFLVQWILQLVK